MNSAYGWFMMGRGWYHAPVSPRPYADDLPLDRPAPSPPGAAPPALTGVAARPFAVEEKARSAFPLVPLSGSEKEPISSLMVAVSLASTATTPSKRSTVST